MLLLMLAYSSAPMPAIALISSAKRQVGVRSRRIVDHP